MEIPIPSSVPNPDKIYYKEIILKKEASRVWTEYYAVLCDRFLIFNRKDQQNGTFMENNCTMLELTSRTTVAYARKSCYRFPFHIRIGKLTYQFKCETNLQRYRWVCSLRLAIAGKPPEPPPKFIPTRYSRGKMAKKEDKRSLRERAGSTTSRSNPGNNREERRNGHVNGFVNRSHERLSDSEEESELHQSSHAVRLQQNKDSLLLTNKNALLGEENPSFAFNRSAVRKLSFAEHDLEIVDIDDYDQFDKDFDKDSNSSNSPDHHGGKTKNRDRAMSTASNDSQAKKKSVSINDRPTDMEAEHNRFIANSTSPDFETPRITQMLSDSRICDSAENNGQVKYRLYPDNMKSYSWTSLGIMRKQPAPRRENSAPAGTRRNQRYARNLASNAFYINTE